MISLEEASGILVISSLRETRSLPRQRYHGVWLSLPAASEGGLSGKRAPPRAYFIGSGVWNSASGSRVLLLPGGHFHPVVTHNAII